MEGKIERKKGRKKERDRRKYYKERKMLSRTNATTAVV